MLAILTLPDFFDRLIRHMKANKYYLALILLAMIECACGHKYINQKGIVPAFFNKHVLYAYKSMEYDEINIVTDGEILSSNESVFSLPIDGQVDVQLNGIGIADIQAWGIENNKIFLEHIFPGEAMLSDSSQKGEVEIFYLEIKEKPNR